MYLCLHSGRPVLPPPRLCSLFATRYITASGRRAFVNETDLSVDGIDRRWRYCHIASLQLSSAEQLSLAWCVQY